MSSSPSSQEKIKIFCDVNDDKITEGFLIKKSLPTSEKTLLALKKLATFWGIALFSILIPVLHFVLVPLFFILGIFLAYRTSQSEGSIVEGYSHCPHCRTEFKIKAGELQWPLSEICQNCARLIRINKQAP